MRVLVTLTAYDPVLPGERTFYLTNATPFITGPGETPASQSFDPTLAQPLDIARRVQGIGGSPRPALGEIRIHNADGAYDAWAGYAWDGRAVTVRIGPDSGAYPSAYPLQWSGTMDRVDIVREFIVVRVRDRLADLDVPLLTNRFDGDNVAPDGLEGDASLTDRVKPRAYGVVRDVPTTLVNAQKLIYHVSDNALASVQDVRDSGVALGPYLPVDFSAAHTAPPGLSKVSTDGETLVSASVTSGQAIPQTSPDGVTWTARVSPFTSIGTSATFCPSAYSPSLDRFVMFSTSASATQVATSDDGGVTWTIRTAAATTRTILVVRWCPVRSLFVAPCGNTAEVHTSPDGITWTAQAITGTGWRDVAVGGPLLVAVAATTTPTGAIATSPDGVTWTTVTEPNPIYSALYHQGVYLIGGQRDSEVWRSQDGLEWVPMTVSEAVSGRRISNLEAYQDVIVAMCEDPSGSDSGNLAYARSPVGPWFTVRVRAPSATLAGRAIAFKDRWHVFASSSWRSGLPSSYASLADLEDDTLEPVAGSYKWIGHSTGSYVRLGALPAGDILADVTHGSTAADRTAAQLILDVLTDAGYTSADWVAADFTALDTAENAECGVYLTGGETIAEVVDALARTPGAWWGVDASGDVRVQQLTAPSGSSTFTITEHDVLSLERVASSDPLLGLPSTSTTLRYVNASTETLDGTATDTDATVLTTHLLAQTTEEETQFTQYADALAEATRRQTLRGTMRSAFRVELPMETPAGIASEFATLDLGAVGTLSHPRFGLSGGVLVRILGVQPNHAAKTITLTLWY